MTLNQICFAHAIHLTADKIFKKQNNIIIIIIKMSITKILMMIFSENFYIFSDDNEDYNEVIE